MSSIAPDPLAPAPIERQGIRLGDILFKGVAAIAAVGVTALLAFLTYKIFNLAWPAMKEFGRLTRDDGLRAALAWRDGPYSTGPLADHDAAIRRHR